MERHRLLRRSWKILNDRSPSTVSELIDIILQNRNIDPITFSGELKDLSQHLSIRGMAEGAALLASHMANHSKIVVVADYDCDGITSAAQLALFFQETGYGNFTVIIPSRSEGYGIPKRAITENTDAKVFVALDCGTLELESVRLACSMGADCIVIDHHEVPAAGLAQASVLINPKQPECGSSFKEFCASGLTFLFLASLRRALRGVKTGLTLPALGGKYLALAATGTVADLVPLVSANRILARSGLRNLNANGSAPLSYLAASAGLAGKTLTAGHIGFHLGPRINAAGRISEGKIAYDLLISSEPSRLERLAAELEGLNADRRQHEERIMTDIAARLERRPHAGRTLVMGSPDWQPGVVGIAASRVQQDLYFAPVVIFAIDEATGIARGSGRSIPGFDIHYALSMCSELLIKWGGHKTAAGMTIAASRIEQFAGRFEDIARHHQADIFVPYGKVDMHLPPALVGPKLVKALEELEPHGVGNPLPVFALRGVNVKSTKVFGKQQNHLKFEFENGLEGIWWRGAQRIRAEDGESACIERPIGGRNTDDGRLRADPRLSSPLHSSLDIIFHLTWDGFYNRPMLEIIDAGKNLGF